MEVIIVGVDVFISMGILAPLYISTIPLLPDTFYVQKKHFESQFFWPHQFLCATLETATHASKILASEQN